MGARPCLTCDHPCPNGHPAVCRGGPFAELLTEAGAHGARQEAVKWLSSACADPCDEGSIKAAWQQYKKERTQAPAVKAATKAAKKHRVVADMETGIAAAQQEQQPPARVSDAPAAQAGAAAAAAPRQQEQQPPACVFDAAVAQAGAAAAAAAQRQLITEAVEARHGARAAQLLAAAADGGAAGAEAEATIRAAVVASRGAFAPLALSGWQPSAEQQEQ